MNQSELISKFNDEYRQKFNPYFFERNEDAIVEKILNVILSSQRDKSFTIKVKHWEVVQDYATIMKYLKEYEESSPNKKRRKDNKKNTTHSKWKVTTEYVRDMSCEDVYII